MMRLQNSVTEGPSSPLRPCISLKYGDPTSLKGRPRIVLSKVEAARVCRRPRASDGSTIMSNSDTRGSVIVGVCQNDPERWREFDSIYRPMLMAFLRKQRLNDSDANDVVQDIFIKLLAKIQTYDREKFRFRTWRWFLRPRGRRKLGRWLPLLSPKHLTPLAYPGQMSATIHI